MGRLKQFGRHWNALGRDNPYGAILTGPDGEIGDWKTEEFFATGRTDAMRFISDLDRIRPNVARQRALDFGCGIGRVTRALAEHFQSVVGLDVAESMISRARSLNNGQRNCQFVTNDSVHLRLFADASFNVVYSRLVLQHIPARLLRRYIPELVRVTQPGGIIMFQLPQVIARDSEDVFLDAPVLGNPLKRRLPRILVRAYRVAKYRYLVNESAPRMLMFGMEQNNVISLVQKAGGQIVTIQPDQALGPEVPSFEYWVTK
jgi:ubiquinone/menaquinone biosynthesis C-methylase UbiE